MSASPTIEEFFKAAEESDFDTVTKNLRDYPLSEARESRIKRKDTNTVPSTQSSLFTHFSVRQSKVEQSKVENKENLPQNPGLSSPHL